MNVSKAKMALLWHLLEWLLILATVGLVWAIIHRNTPDPIRA